MATDPLKEEVQGKKSGPIKFCLSQIEINILLIHSYVGINTAEVLSSIQVASSANSVPICRTKTITELVTFYFS